MTIIELFLKWVFSLFLQEDKLVHKEAIFNILRNCS